MERYDIESKKSEYTILDNKEINQHRKNNNKNNCIRKLNKP